MTAAVATVYRHPKPVPSFEDAISADLPLGALTPSYPITPPATLSEQCNATCVPSPDDSVPPPVPPKSPNAHRPKSVKSVSIVAPTDISPVQCVLSHSESHIARHNHTSSRFPAGSSDSAPAPPTLFTSQHSAAQSSGIDSLPFPFSSAPLTARPPGMGPVIHEPSSMHARRNRLHKTRPQPPTPSPPTSSSVLGLLLSRAFGSGECLSRHTRLSSGSSMSDRSYLPTRSRSDGSTKGSLTRPSPSSRSSDTTDSTCTTSSSASTSYASTGLTTPDSMSPSVSPRNSTRANKLQKKRPSLAPSAYQNPLGSRAAPLGRSKSTPNGLHQRTPRNRIWSSVEEARHAAEEAYTSGEPEPPSWSYSPTEVSPTSRSSLGPILEVRKKTSLQALSDLACTGICSASTAARSSRLALDTNSFGGSSQDHVWHGHDAALFDPYADCSSPGVGTRSSQPFPTSGSPQSPSQSDSLNVAAATSGFAVVNGYLDRSEDAMRRWTLAMADVPDEVLLHHLERLRKESVALARGRLPGRKSAAPSQVGHGDEEFTVQDRRSSFCFGGPREMGLSPRSTSRARFSVGHYDQEEEGDDSDDEALSDGDDEEDWKTARQVLFCCRELVQTERNYQARLRDLVSMELTPHYASLVARCIPALLRVSEIMLAHLLDDPSAWGVSAAFLGCEEELENALVAWSGVVGEFFVEDAILRPPRKLTKKYVDETHSNLGHDTSSSSIGRVFRTRSQVGVVSPNRGSRRFSTTMSDIGHDDASSNTGHGAGMFTAALGTGLAFGLSVPGSQLTLEPERPVSGKSPKQSAHVLGRVPTSSSGLSRAMNAWKRKSMPSSLNHIPNLTMSTIPNSVDAHSSHNHVPGHSRSTQGHTPSKKQSERDTKMSARDLAIQPTQRVMRYVLQYRDLLDHTPTTSPSRPLVERAYDSALRIAKRCDRAQAHAAFLRQSSDGPKSEKHSLPPTTVA